MPGLHLQNVTLRYGAVAALTDLHLTVEAGEVVAVLGVNGAGKSTLVDVAAGLRRPDAGQVTVAGLDVHRRPAAARRRLGVAGQDVGLYPTETLRDNLRLFGDLSGVAGAGLADRIDTVAAALTLEDVLDRRADRCSAGQRRRAHVAAALLHRPRVLLLDEPAAHLDPAGRAALRLLARQAADGGTAVCWCTNDPEEATDVADTVAILDRGRLVVRGAPSELARRLSPPTVELRFVGAAPATLSEAGAAVEGDRARVVVPSPAAAVTEALEVVGDHLDRLRPARGALVLARHEVRLLRRDPLPFVLLLAFPLAVTAFFRPALALALFSEGYVRASGAEQAVPGVATTFSMFLVGFVGLSFFRDHGWDTWERLRASPLTNARLFAGKVLPLLAVAWAQLGLLFAFGVLVFGFSIRGSALALVVLAGVLGCTSVALGLALVSTARTLAQVNIVANLGTVVVAGVGGALVPLSLLPAWARSVAPVSPAYWAMRGFRSVALEGGGIREVLLPVAVLAGATLLLVAWTLHRVGATDARLRWT